MFHDLCKLAMLGLALSACSGDKTTTDSGLGTDTDTDTTMTMTDTDTTMTMGCDTSCVDYCTTYLGACLDDPNNTYTNQADCESKCAAFTCGTAADTSGNTLGCRAYHAGAAAGAGATDADTHCPHAAEVPTDICL